MRIKVTSETFDTEFKVGKVFLTEKRLLKQKLETFIFNRI